MKRWLAFVMALLLTVSSVGVMAEEPIPVVNTLPKGSDYTANKAVAAALDVVFNTYGPGTYFTYDGGPCTDHNTNANCAFSGAYDCNCRRVLEDGTDMLAWQCFGFARYVFYTCFGFIDHEYISPGKYESLGAIAAGSMTVDNAKALLSRGKTGAHIRTSGHSMILLSSDGGGLSILHANVKNQCDVVLQTMTWDSFVKVYNAQGIKYVNMPKEYPAGNSVPVTTPTVVNGVYTLKNQSTGRLLQVNGTDQNEAPVNTAAANNSVAQQFRLQHVTAGRYYLRTMLSSNGSNRVLDVIRGSGGTMTGGNKLEIYAPVDDDAQLFRFLKNDDDSYRIEIAASPGVVVTDTAKASSQITTEVYTQNSRQHWLLTRVDTPVTDTKSGVYTVAVDEGSVLNMRAQPVDGAVLITIPYNTPVPVAKVENNWGYTYYKGYKGWISMDYAKKVRPLGDVNGNGSVEAADALTALQGSTKKVTLKAVEMTAADLPPDGTVTAGDALRILQLVTKKIEALL